jgi:hypothetical protein
MMAEVLPVIFTDENYTASTPRISGEDSVLPRKHEENY